MAPLNTYGLEPMSWWKLFEVDGWQVLVSVEEDEQREGRFGVRISAAIGQLEEVTTITLSAADERFARTVFAEMTDGRKVLQTFLDQVGPMANKMGIG
ncbi:hypothetical protein [uncultured Brevundimonas sp.]|uniref:hypothetical protein n=1 Tax=uncultured Brevundimonas sp. TaxID=213418 RepID=UPI0025E78756|nr:hypothetical protein [uncultured Brevundimonas sp.]